MSLLSPYYSRISFGLGGFTEPHFVSDPGDPHRSRFDSYAARLARYRVLWSHYEGNVYRKIHGFAEALKAEFDLYRAIRTVYSPAYRGIEFWAEHLLAGLLDDEAGDGQERPSAIPIKVRAGHPKEVELRAAIARLWRDSVWQVLKDNWTRFGAALGDVGLAIADDTARKKVFLRVIHPSIVKEVDLDPQRNCKGYVFEEWRPDPRETNPFVTPRLVKYNEVATKVGRRVHYETFLDEEPFDWGDYPDETSPRIGASWTEDYGFIPFVWHQHRDMGLKAGWAEMHPTLSKLQELDDLASKVIDQVRKSVDPKWLFAGVDKVSDFVALSASKDDKGDAARNEERFFGCPDPAVKAQPLIAPLDLAAANAQIEGILGQIEKDHPELTVDGSNVISGSASGRARRIARELIEARVAARRAGYDNTLVRAIQMGISMAGGKGYSPYEAFDEGSFARGELDFSIGDRPVFAMDTMDDIEEGTAFWQMAAAAVAVGMPLEVFLRREGWSGEDIDEIREARDVEESAKLDRVNRSFGGAGQEGDGGGDGETGDGAAPPDDLFQLSLNGSGNANGVGG